MKPDEGVSEETGKSENLDRDKIELESEPQKPAGAALSVSEIKSPGDLSLFEESTGKS